MIGCDYTMNSTNKEYKLYIVISQTGTMFSKIVRLFTRDPYNHSSISLNEDLTDMYSFGRKYARFPFPGGFIQECIGKKVFATHPNTTMIVYELTVTKEQYDKVIQIVREMRKQKNMYAYNLLGVIFVIFHKYHPSHNKYYCSEFVKYILTESGIATAEELPVICKPMDFLKVNGNKIYEGRMKNYNTYNGILSV